MTRPRAEAGTERWFGPGRTSHQAGWSAWGWQDGRCWGSSMVLVWWVLKKEKHRVTHGPWQSEERQDVFCQAVLSSPRRRISTGWRPQLTALWKRWGGSGQVGIRMNEGKHLVMGIRQGYFSGNAEKIVKISYWGWYSWSDHEHEGCRRTSPLPPTHITV